MAAQERDPRGAEPAAQSLVTVLIVEDNKGLLHALDAALSRAGFRVLTATDGREALQRVEGETVDLVVTDVRLGALTGLDVLRALKQRSPEVEVIMMTGSAEMELVLSCLRAGAFDFVQKPFEVEQLQRSIERAMERKRYQSSAHLYAASQAILTAKSSEDVTTQLLELAQQALRASDVSLLLPRGGPHGLRLHYGPALRGQPPREPAVAMRVAAARRPEVLVGPLNQHPRFADLPASPRVSSSIVYPLFAQDRLVGVLNLNREDPVRPFRAADLPQASILASQLLLAIENSRLIRETVSNERLAAVGQLVAGVAHEIGNPVAFILSNLGFLQEELPLAESAPAREELMGAVRDALEGAHRIEALVKDLVGLAREEQHSGAVELEEPIRAAMRISSAQLRTCQQLTCEIERPLPVKGSTGRLSQVFINLLVNAAHAVEAVPPERRRIEVRAQREGRWVAARVIDSGKGIPADQLDRIFEPFFTTKPTGKGTGLGLSLARDIVTRYGGELLAESTPGVGSAFTVRLPVAQEGA